MSSSAVSAMAGGQHPAVRIDVGEHRHEAGRHGGRSRGRKGEGGDERPRARPQAEGAQRQRQRRRTRAHGGGGRRIDGIQEANDRFDEFVLERAEIGVAARRIDAPQPRQQLVRGRQVGDEQADHGRRIPNAIIAATQAATLDPVAACPPYALAHQT
jgi:hypothetical protein